MKYALLAAALLAAAPFATAPRRQGPRQGRLRRQAARGRAAQVEGDKTKGCCTEGQSVATKDPTLLIDEKGGIANCVITVAVEGAKVEPLKEPGDDRPEGLPLSSRTSWSCRWAARSRSSTPTPARNNIHTFARKTDQVNRAVGTAAGRSSRCLQGNVEVRCDYHPWMSSRIIVTDTPYWAISAADGSFEISGLAPGHLQGRGLARAARPAQARPDGGGRRQRPAGELKMAFKKKG
jgi:hypothetical protein